MNINPKSTHTFNLGDLVIDTITGFTGVVIAETRWLNGCVRLVVQPKELKDGKPIDAITFDIEQLRIVTAKLEPAATRSGGPCPDPVRR